MNRLIVLLAVFLLLTLGSGIGAAAEIYVQPGDSIQTALDNATSGDIIILKPGTYAENIKITKDNLLIGSESGNPDDTIITAKDSNNHAIYLQANNVKISGLGITGTKDSYTGIYLSGCNNCIIENNKILNNGYGIYLLNSKGNTLSGNIMSSNGVYGLFVCPQSDDNLIYNNYFNNTVNAEIENGIGNAYNTTKTEGTNIVGGSYLGGNFWAEPDGTGFSETAVDADGDGIADFAYRLANSIYSDELPLTSASSLQQPVLPVVNFEMDNNSGPALFGNNETGENTTSANGSNGNITGDGGTNYSQNGDSGDGESSHRSIGGGTGVSPEPARNVETKEISQTFITDGKEVKFDLKNNSTCVLYLTFDSKKTVGKTTTIVEMLKAKSSLISEPPSNAVYRYFNIWVGDEGYANSTNIENPVVYFKVEKAWIQDKNINKTSITLNSYSAGKWGQLPVNLLEEDDRFLYFTAQIPEFSFFAITGKSEAGETPVADSGLDSQPDSQPGSKATDLNGENAGAINSLSVKSALEKKESARSPGFETVYGVISLLALFLYKKIKPEN